MTGRTKKSSMIRVLLVWNLALVTAFILLTGIFLYVFFYRDYIDKAIAKNGIIAKTIVTQIDQFLGVYPEMLLNGIDLIDSGLVSEAEIDKYLYSIISSRNVVLSLEAVDFNGRVAHAASKTGQTAGISRSGEPFMRWFDEHISPYWSPPFVSPQSGNPTITLALKGSRYYLVAYLDILGISLYSTTFAETFGSDLELKIADRHGIYISDSDMNAVYQRQYLNEFTLAKSRLEAGEGTYRSMSGGAAGYTAVHFIPETEWYVMLRQSEADMLRPVSGIFILDAAAMALVFALTVIIVGYLDLRLRRQVEAFLVQTNDISAGRYGHRLGEQPYSELEKLALSINAMAENIESRETNLRDTNLALSESKERYRLLIDNSTDIIYSLDSEGRIQNANRAFLDFCGKYELDVLGKLYRELFQSIEPHEPWKTAFESVTGEGRERSFQETYSPEGDVRHFHITLIPVLDKLGRLHSIIGTNHDITAIMKKEETITRLAYYDTLTKLANRTLFTERVADAIERGSIRGEGFRVLIADLDNFQKINDSAGHRVGDRILCEVANRLRVVSKPEEFVARLGGDEFGVIVDDGANPGRSVELCQSILAAVSDPFQVDEFTYYLNCSIGIATYPDDGKTFEELVKNADTALHKTKDSGKNNFQFFTLSMKDEIVVKMNFEAQLRDALDKDEIFPMYQPQIALATGRIRGVETLMRWKNKRFGVVSPAVFVPILEDTGMIIPYGDWILRQSCRDWKHWSDKGMGGLIDSVNISAAQLQQRNFLERFAVAIEETGMNRERLEVELTESVLINNFDEVLSKMKTLRDWGVKIALDDFGTGFSSLSYLRKLPITTLKIDKSFVDDIFKRDGDGRGTDFVAAIIDFAHILGMEVVAEGAETAAQVEYLRGHGCDIVQGYYFSKPLMPQDIPAFS